MIDYKTTTLSNGLKVVAHRDQNSQMAAVNIIYMVGSRDESPDRTGFAHLFEHLMFRGTSQVPHFDVPVQMASGENNAFTSNDYTDFYITLPKANIETAFWLESDRMAALDISVEHFEAEKKVVIEEFNQRYLNQPYGDQWLLLRPLIYKKHPYRWTTIGVTPDHIAQASIEDVRSFYRRFYNPSNAILSVAADIEPEEIFALAQRWFGDLPSVDAHHRQLPLEPTQTTARRMEVERKVPATMLTVAFPMAGRTEREFYVCDLITDLLGGGASARLYLQLVKEQKLFSAVDGYLTGDIDPGLFVLTGQLSDEISVEQAEQGLWEQLNDLKTNSVGDYELEKVKNKFEANTVFGELNVMNKAMNLGFYTLLGDTSLMNKEVAIYRSVTKQEILDVANKLFTPERSSTLIIHPEDEK